MTTASENTAASQRLISIDALRGFTMFWIISGGWILRSFAVSGCVTPHGS